MDKAPWVERRPQGPKCGCPRKTPDKTERVSIYLALQGKTNKTTLIP
jgi:hypothetical protein